MENRLIMLPQPILVSDEEIKGGDFMYLKEYHHQGQIRKCHYITDEQLMIDAYEDIGWGFCKRNEVYEIIAGLPDLLKLDLSLIADEIGWVDVEKLAWIYMMNMHPSDRREAGNVHPSDRREAGNVHYKNGFKAAQSLNEKKWTDDDMIDFQNFISSYPNRELKRGLTLPYYLEKFKQSRKPKEYLVEVEMEVNQCDGCISGHHIIDGIHKAPYPSGSMVCKKHLYDRPKITNNTIKVIKILH